MSELNDLSKGRVARQPTPTPREPLANQSVEERHLKDRSVAAEKLTDEALGQIILLAQVFS